MSALADLFYKITTDPRVCAAATSHDLSRPEYRDGFNKVLDEFHLPRIDADGYPDVTDPDEPELPASELPDITTPKEI